MLVLDSVAASNDGKIGQGNNNRTCLEQASLLKNHSSEPWEVLAVAFQPRLHFNIFLIKHLENGKNFLFPTKSSSCKVRALKKPALGRLPAPLLSPSPSLSMVAIASVPRSLLSFINKPLAPLITKKTFEMWNEFKPTQQCVLKSLDTCNNSSWMCELAYSLQQSARSEAKSNRSHMVQWLDHYFGICDVQV